MLLQVITGTTRQGRFSERVAAWVHRPPAGSRRLRCGAAIDLRDHPLPFFAAEMAPGRRPSGVYEDDEVARLVSNRGGAPTAPSSSPGEYNHGYPAVLKNAMDSTFVGCGASRSLLSAGATLGALVPSSNCVRWRWSSRWRRCAGPCTSCPTC